jgi:hypothetical protein
VRNKDPFGAPAEAFMALELDEGVLEVFLNSWPSKMALIYGLELDEGALEGASGVVE